MEKYQVLDHISDLKIKAFGKTKEELFSNTLFGMFDSIKPELKKTEEIAKRKIKIESLDSPALLVDFLSEALYLSQINKESYFEANFNKFSDKFLEGEIKGKKVERFGEEIKAVTHHDLDIHKRSDGIWEATVLFDI